MTADHPTDDDLLTALRPVSHVHHPDPAALVGAAVREGRGRVRRRRATLAAAAAVAVLLTGAGAWAGVSQHLLAVDGDGLVADPAPAPTSAPPAPLPTPAADSSTDAAAQAPSPGPDGPSTSADPSSAVMTARVAALHLARLAPSGTLSRFRGQQSADALYVEARLDRGDGPVGLQVNVQSLFAGAPVAELSAEQRDFVDGFFACPKQDWDRCERTVDPDGGLTVSGTESVGSATIVHVDRLRADGTRVVVMTGDTADLKYGGAVHRGVTTAQAERIAASPVWDFFTPDSAVDSADAERQIRPWTLIPG